MKSEELIDASHIRDNKLTIGKFNVHFMFHDDVRVCWDERMIYRGKCRNGQQWM